jgi:uncharacterized protein YecT (DUF1311 family)
MSGVSGQLLRRTFMATVASWFAASACFGIDNPDAPDLLGQFQKRASVYEARISTAAGSTSEIVRAYASYQSFLDSELTKVYSELVKKLTPASRTALTQSQRRWLGYRDAEFRFIEKNWTQSQFGTSADLSRGAYRASIVKERLTLLIQYLKNYP